MIKIQEIMGFCVKDGGLAGFSHFFLLFEISTILNKYETYPVVYKV